MTPQQKQYQDMKSVFTDILRDLQEIINGYEQNGSFERLKRALEYNLQKSGLNSVLLATLTYEHLVKSKKTNPEDLRLVQILGWCAEILGTGILIFDDIMDNGTLRHGQPCWHTLEGIGQSALNDAFTMEHAVYALLRKNFRHLPCYAALMDIFHEASFITVCGHNLDITGSNETVIGFNMESYNTMAVNKSYNILYLPIALVMCFVGFTDFEDCKEIIRRFTLFLQIQNDFLDCFGTLETAGKIGTDIEDNKCSWLAITCMERANDEQKLIMLDCYGSSDPDKVLRVKELYKSLDLPGVYATYEEDSYKSTKALIKQTSNDVHQEILLAFIAATRFKVRGFGHSIVHLKA